MQSYDEQNSLSDNTWASDLKSFVDDSQIQKRFNQSISGKIILERITIDSIVIHVSTAI